MQLPDLPKIIKKREAQYTPAVLAWFRLHGPSSCLIEIKATTRNRIPASALLPHQKRALLDAAGGGIVWKIPDEARRQTPCDAFKISFAKGYVVCVFTTTRRAVAINVKNWQGASLDTLGDYQFDV